MAARGTLTAIVPIAVLTTALVVERREDPRRHSGRAAAVDELEHRVEVDAAVSRKPGGEVGSETDGYEASAAPPDDRAELRTSVV
jgi:hypothetical protein